MPRLLLAFLAALALAALPARASEPVTVFAAASLTDALTKAARLHEARGGGKIRLSFAASSALARQIEAGAPAALFLSADQQWMDYLADRDLIDPATRVSPIGNRLVLIAPKDAPPGPADIAAAIATADGRIAVADPDHVPAGRYARQGLEALGLWTRVKPRLARADNVRAALAFVERGETRLGIVYATDAAASPGVRIVAAFPDGSHAPVTYPFAAIRGRAGPEALAFLRFLSSEEGLAVMEGFGFSRTRSGG